MVSKKKCRGSCASRFIGFLFMVVVAFMLIGPLLRCAQQLPQMAGNAASHAASGAKNAAVNGIKNWWNGQSEADKFKRVCENLGVEGVDKLCPYFAAGLQGVSDSEAKQTECYLTAAGTGPDGAARLQAVRKACPQAAGDVSAFQGCVETQVKATLETGDWASCMPQAEGPLARFFHAVSQPFACIPGLPKSWCETSSSSASASASNSTAPPSPPTRTDPNYLQCLQKYYQLLPMYNEALQCGSTVNAQNASCARSQLLAWPYQGQHFGVAQVKSCDDMPQ